MKTLLIAAVAAKFTSVAMADISISGSGGDKADVTLTGKSGDTSIGLDAGNAVEQLYATSSVAGTTSSVAGVKLTRKLASGATFGATYTETKASGSMGGVSVSAHASS